MNTLYGYVQVHGQLAFILIKWKRSFAVDGCRRTPLKDFDTHEAQARNQLATQGGAEFSERGPIFLKCDQ